MLLLKHRYKIAHGLTHVPEPVDGHRADQDDGDKAGGAQVRGCDQGVRLVLRLPHKHEDAEEDARGQRHEVGLERGHEDESWEPIITDGLKLISLFQLSFTASSVLFISFDILVMVSIAVEPESLYLTYFTSASVFKTKHHDSHGFGAGLTFTLWSMAKIGPAGPSTTGCLCMYGISCDTGCTIASGTAFAAMRMILITAMMSFPSWVFSKSIQSFA
ncbi:hypothetical protein N7493_006669 [Penicillium malachiteum]|uniref:Uncharacterized protein n=1 Tax=Penicillium malachiteum TaxID=1324776 RepID=A0AAD6HL21_9EURO|nr:hypothetical protein N7493_006669 [Penicillium malachiteum]